MGRWVGGYVEEGRQLVRWVALQECCWGEGRGADGCASANKKWTKRQWEVAERGEQRGEEGKQHTQTHTHTHAHTQLHKATQRHEAPGQCLPVRDLLYERVEGKKILTVPPALARPPVLLRKHPTDAVIQPGFGVAKVGALSFGSLAPAVAGHIHAPSLLHGQSVLCEDLIFFYGERLDMGSL